MAKATISKVALANTANGPRIVLSLSNGDTQWYPQSYVTKLLEANFMGGSRPTVLIGTEVTYTKVEYKVGDFSVDNDGNPTKVKHTKDGSKLIKFEFGEIAGNVSEFDKAQMLANAVASATVRAAQSSTATKAKLAAVLEEDEEEEDEEETLPEAKSEKVK